MTQQTSRSVTSNQTRIHDDLISRVVKHLATPFDKPVAEHSLDAFKACRKQVETQDKSIILDAGCGVGASTRVLAEKNPNSWVIGVDQSAHRLAKRPKLVPDNCLYFRADLVDFWRLALAQRWHLKEHYLLYPNPWPKAKHYMRRWHAHPILPTILNLGGRLTLRSNWDLYVLEFATAMDYLNYKTSDIQTVATADYLTPFEKKYAESGQILYEIMVELA